MQNADKYIQNFDKWLDKKLDEIEKSASRPKLLLHVCCAPCSSYVLAMTFPAIVYAGDHRISGIAGFAVGVLLALKKKSLIVVAIASCATVFIVEQLIKFL